MATDRVSDYDEETTRQILRELADLVGALGFAGMHLNVIGGLVPSLLVPVLDPGVEPHAGSGDIDLCLSLALSKGEVGDYERLEASLKKQGFVMAARTDGSTESWRWRGGADGRLVIEFFCPVPEGLRAGSLYRPGGVVGGRLSALCLASGALIDRDSVEVVIEVDGRRIPIRVTGPCAYSVAKVDALLHREKNKDAYDLIWLYRNWPGGPVSLSKELRRSVIFNEPQMQKAFREMGALFADIDATGSRRYANFLVQDGSVEERDATAREAATTIKILIASLGSS